MNSKAKKVTKATKPAKYSYKCGYNHQKPWNMALRDDLTSRFKPIKRNK